MPKKTQPGLLMREVIRTPNYQAVYIVNTSADTIGFVCKTLPKLTGNLKEINVIIIFRVV